MSNILELLPAEIIMKILSFLSISDLMIVRAVNSQLLQWIDSDIVGWKKIAVESYPFLSHYENPWQRIRGEMPETKKWQHLCKELQNIWRFDENAHHSDICLINNRLTAKKIGKTSSNNKEDISQRARVAFCTQPVLEGMFYFEAIVDFISSGSKIGVGICSSTAALNEPLWHAKGGAIYSDGTTGHHCTFISQMDTEITLRAGDIIGVYLDFSTEGGRSITFAVNGIITCTPYWYVPLVPMFAAVVLFGEGDQVTINPWAHVVEYDDSIAFRNCIRDISFPQQ